MKWFKQEHEVRLIRKLVSFNKTWFMSKKRLVFYNQFKSVYKGVLRMIIIPMII